MRRLGLFVFACLLACCTVAPAQQASFIKTRERGAGDGATVTRNESASIESKLLNAQGKVLTYGGRSLDS